MDEYFRHRSDCSFCGGEDLVKFIEMKDMPLAGGFLRKDDIGKEKLYPLDVYFCRTCKLVQLLDVVPKEVLFDEYLYLSSTTRTLNDHFTELARTLRDRFLGDDSFVVEIGSNDGVFLKPMRAMGVRCLGFEPSKNVSKIARSHGLNIVNDFFTEKSASAVAAREGRCDMVSASNVFAHIEDMHDVVRGIRSILKPDGVFVFEVHYLLDFIKKMQYDMIYHEHLYYHSITALRGFFKQFDMEIFDVERIPLHEGSIRVFVKNSSSGKNGVKKVVGELVSLESESGLDREETFIQFGVDVQRHINELVGILKKLKSQGKRIVGYGAPGRGTLVLNYGKIGTDLVEYLTDESATRQGKYVPGVHIPILSPEKFRSDKPEYALMLAWSYMKEILSKEQDFISSGGRFIVPFPWPRIIP